MSSIDVKGIGMTSQRTRSRLVQRLRDEGIEWKRVLDTMERVPRHAFVDEAMSHRAYEDSALPIGMGQTISQPYIVAKMTSLLFDDGKKTLNRVLEIGTGCGYQTAVLSHLTTKVFTLERIKVLQDKARARLRQLGLLNIEYHHGDGWQGWAEGAVFDGVIVTAAAATVPLALKQQLSPDGGRMVLPVGPVDGEQQLTLIVRTGNAYQTCAINPVRFVPMLKGELE